MDSSNCSHESAATDRIMIIPFMLPTIEETCATNKYVYIGGMTVLTIVRCSFALFQFKLWRNREKKLAQRVGKKRGRIPIVPILSFVGSLALVLLTVLTSINIANSGNGIPTLLQGIINLAMYTQGLIMYKRIIELGARIIPLSKTTLTKIGNTKALVSLNQQPTWYRAVSYIVLATFGTIFISSIIVGPIIAPNYAQAQILAATSGIYTYIVVMLSIFHIQRIITAIKDCQTSDNNVQVSNDIKGAIRMLRIQQLGPAVVCVVCVIVYILVVIKVILMSYL
jgi:hypothetical protein